MRRMLTWLVLAGLAWWGYSAFWGGENAEAAAGGGDDVLFDDVLPAETPRQAPPLNGTPERAEADPGVPMGESEPTEVPNDKVGRFVAALRSGDERSRAKAFAIYRRLENPDDRRRVAAALEELLADCDGLGEAAAWLGEGNDFLHTDLGRTLAADLHDRVYQAPAKDALPVSTRILEQAIDGPIALEDEAARTALSGLYERHKHLVRRVVFDPGNAARSRRHRVQSGESLERIARRFRDSGIQVSSGTLAIVNRITNPNALQIGQNLRIPVDPIHCVVRRASFTLAIYVGDDLVRLYPISHGKPGHETPETTFVVGDTISNPDWHHGGRVIPFGDPENPLGRYFVKFRHESYTGFGAHGTNEPHTIGTAASRGCLRLLPDDIAEFAKFVPAGAAVVVR